jgi:hypothetical protein
LACLRLAKAGFGKPVENGLALRRDGYHVLKHVAMLGRRTVRDRDVALIAPTDVRAFACDSTLRTLPLLTCGLLHVWLDLTDF